MKRSLFILTALGVLLLAVLLLATQVLPASAKADERAVSAANALYESGHYAEAAQIYEQLAAQGVRDGELLYNLGNTYFQQGDLPRAIVQYELAAQLAPRDPDIRHNLELARAEARIATVPPDGPLAILADASRRWLSLNELALLALAAWFAFGLLLLGYRHYEPGRRPAVLRYAVLVAIFFVLITGAVLVTRTLALPDLPTLSPMAEMAGADLPANLP